MLVKDIIKEGANFMGYYKKEREEDGKKQIYWTFPDDLDNEETGYYSNASAREILDALGFNPDFEESSPIEIDKFINISTAWLKSNIGKQSQEIPSQRDGNMIAGGKPEGWMNRQVFALNKEARGWKTKHPEITHVDFA